MLALELGRTVSADRLAEGLWGEAPPPSAAKMVQLYVSHLRRALDGDGVRIVTHGRGYELELADGDVDAARFERLLDESRPREALALWHGDALADLADEPFAATEIRRLDELRLRASESAIDADLEAGRHARGDRRAGRAGRRAAAARAPARPAHARALPLGPAVGGTRGLPRRALPPRGGDRGRARRRAAASCRTRSSPRTRRSTCPAGDRVARRRRPPPRRASRWLLVGAAALLLAGVTAFGVIRVLEPEGLAGHRRELRRSDRP